MTKPDDEGLADMEALCDEIDGYEAGKRSAKEQGEALLDGLFFVWKFNKANKIPPHDFLKGFTSGALEVFKDVWPCEEQEVSPKA